MSGSYPGPISLFVGEEGGKFAAARILSDAAGANLNVGRAAAVHVTDWNRDGRLDLVVGNISGEVILVPGVAGETAPSFGAPRKLSAGGEGIRVPNGNAGPWVADWNGDGTPDLLVGCGDGSVLLHVGSGETGEPVLGKAEVIVPAGTWEIAPDAPADAHGARAKICVADYDGDGRLDLLIGDFATTPSPAPERDAAERWMSALQDRYTKTYRELTADLPAEVRERAEGETEEEHAGRVHRAVSVSPEMVRLRAKMSELWQLLGKYRRSPSTHGWVRVYLRSAEGD